VADPIATLRRTLANLDGVGGDVQRLLVQAEDALTAVEDREQRRAARTPYGQVRT